MIKMEEGQIIVVNDLLSFVRCKLREFPKKQIIKCLKDFYSLSEASEAYKILLNILKKPKKREKLKVKDPCSAIINYLEENIDKELPLFVCKDLDNIPKIKYVKDVLQRRTQFIEDHKAIKVQINDLYRCLYQIREQFLLLYKKKSLVLSEIIETRSKRVDLTFHKSEKTADKGVKKDIHYLQQLVDEDVATTNEEASLKFSHNNEFTPDTTLILNNDIPNLEENIPNESINLILNKDIKKELNKEHEEIGLVQQDAEAEVSDYFIIEQILNDNIGYLIFYKCNSCDFSSNDETELCKHKCAKKNKKINNIKIKGEVDTFPAYQCVSCFETFISSSDLKFHKKTKHRNDKLEYRCPLCSNMFQEEKWHKHVSLCLGNGETQFTQEDIHCKECDVFFSDEQLLKNHKAFHDSSRPFECHKCKFRFYSQKAVENHFKTHTLANSIISHKCPFCCRAFLLKSKLEEHIRVHTGDRPYKCSQCDFTAMRGAGLSAHLKIHSENKSFVCNVCGRGFKVKSKLFVHKKVHSNSRPFKCPECGKGFKTGREMSTHHRNHLGIRNHPCPYCDYKATNASVLRGHINVHFNKKPFKCSICSFGSNHKSYLNLHMRNSHPGVAITKLK